MRINKFANYQGFSPARFKRVHAFDPLGINDIRIYNRALTPEEVAQNYKDKP